MGGIADREGCGSVLQYDRTGSGGNEVAGGESSAYNIGGDESLSWGEQRADTESFGRLPEGF